MLAVSLSHAMHDPLAQHAAVHHPLKHHALLHHHAVAVHHPDLRDIRLAGLKTAYRNWSRRHGADTEGEAAEQGCSSESEGRLPHHDLLISAGASAQSQEGWGTARPGTTPKHGVSGSIRS